MTTAGDVRLYMTLQKAAHALKKSADQALLDAADLTTAQAAVLVVVKSNKQATQRLLAEQLGLNESAVTAMARRLIARDLLTRTRSETDGRAWALSLSRQGEQALAAVTKPFDGINRKIDEALGPDDVEKLAAALTLVASCFSGQDPEGHQ